MNHDLPSAMELSCGQQNHPDSDAVRSYFNGIFERQYYTESGPLVRRLETEIGQRLGVPHIVCVSNPAVAWIMLLETGLVSRRLILPATAPLPLLEAIRLIGCPHRLFDVTSDYGYRVQRTDVNAYLHEGFDAIIGVNSWGGACDIPGLVQLAEEHDISVYFDSTDAFACHVQQGTLGALGRAEVFAFDVQCLIHGAGSACICTHDEELADRLRCMRSSGGVIRKVPVSKTVNGRMSEAQAAYALIGLKRIDSLISRNREQHSLYEQALSPLPGISFISSKGVTISNYQQAVITLDDEIKRNALLTHLRRLGYEATALRFDANSVAFRRHSGLNRLQSTGLALPLGSLVEAADIRIICDAITTFLAPHPLNPAGNSGCANL